MCKETTLTAIRALLQGEGIADGTIEDAISIVEADGFLPMTKIRKLLGMSRQGIHKLCATHDVPKRTRAGRAGSLVHYPTIRQVYENSRLFKRRESAPV